MRITECYSVLGLERTSHTDTEVKQAYKTMALKWHPKKNKSRDARAKFQEVSLAYRKITQYGDLEDDTDLDEAVPEEVFFSMFESVFGAKATGNEQQSTVQTKTTRSYVVYEDQPCPCCNGHHAKKGFRQRPRHQMSSGYAKPQPRVKRKTNITVADNSQNQDFSEDEDAIPRPPDQMQPPRVTEVNQDSIELCWQKPECHGFELSKYLLEMKVLSVHEWLFTVVYDGKGQRYTIPHLMSGCKYSFRIKATTLVGDGYWSLNVCQTTLGPRLNDYSRHPQALSNLSLQKLRKKEKRRKKKDKHREKAQKKKDKKKKEEEQEQTVKDVKIERSKIAAKKKRENELERQKGLERQHRIEEEIKYQKHLDNRRTKIEEERKYQETLELERYARLKCRGGSELLGVSDDNKPAIATTTTPVPNQHSHAMCTDRKMSGFGLFGTVASQSKQPQDSSSNHKKGKKKKKGEGSKPSTNLKSSTEMENQTATETKKKKQKLSKAAARRLRERKAQASKSRGHSLEKLSYQTTRPNVPDLSTSNDFSDVTHVFKTEDREPHSTSRHPTIPLTQSPPPPPPPSSKPFQAHRTQHPTYLTQTHLERYIQLQHPPSGTLHASIELVDENYHNNFVEQLDAEYQSSASLSEDDARFSAAHNTARPDNWTGQDTVSDHPSCSSLFSVTPKRRILPDSSRPYLPRATNNYKSSHHINHAAALSDTSCEPLSPNVHHAIDVNQVAASDAFSHLNHRHEEKDADVLIPGAAAASTLLTDVSPVHFSSPMLSPSYDLEERNEFSLFPPVDDCYVPVATCTHSQDENFTFGQHLQYDSHSDLALSLSSTDDILSQNSVCTPSTTNSDSCGDSQSLACDSSLDCVASTTSVGELQTSVKSPVAHRGKNEVQRGPRFQKHQNNGYQNVMYERKIGCKLRKRSESGSS